MTESTIVELRDLDVASLAALNNEHAKETSWLSEEGFSQLVEMAFYARGIPWPEGPAALLIAFDQDALYLNPNFEFFHVRYPRFIYIDRLITAALARRKGLARRLYEDLFEAARAAGHTVVGCEVNLDPPNPGSDAFHGGIGFVEVGRAQLNNGKTVRYLELQL